jgi:hypothetical protein
MRGYQLEMETEDAARFSRRTAEAGGFAPEMAQRRASNMKEAVGSEYARLALPERGEITGCCSPYSVATLTRISMKWRIFQDPSRHGESLPSWLKYFGQFPPPPPTCPTFGSRKTCAGHWLHLFLSKAGRGTNTSTTASAGSGSFTLVTARYWPTRSAVRWIEIHVPSPSEAAECSVGMLPSPPVREGWGSAAEPGPGRHRPYHYECKARCAERDSIQFPYGWQTDRNSKISPGSSLAARVFLVVRMRRKTLWR